MTDTATAPDNSEKTAEKMEILFDHSEKMDQIFGALAMAQGKIEQPRKTKTAKVPLKSGGSYSYNYCDIADVLGACLPPFSDEGIAIMQYPSVKQTEYGAGQDKRMGATVSVRTVLGHKSGQWISCTIPAMSESMGPQALGSVITYLRRYGLQLIAGIAADEDEDGNAAQGEQDGGSSGQSTPPGPQRSGAAVTEFEYVAFVENYTSKNIGGGRVQHAIKLSGMDRPATTLDKVLGEKIGRESGTGIKVKVMLKKSGTYLDLLSGNTLPPPGAAT